MLTNAMLKWIVLTILSSFTHSYVVPNLNKFLSSAVHKICYFE